MSIIHEAVLKTMSPEKNPTQPGPKYPSMTIGVHPEIYSHLRDKYGEESVCWPILVYDRYSKC